MLNLCVVTCFPVVHHKLNSLIYFGVIVYRSCKRLKAVLFWPTLYFYAIASTAFLTVYCTLDTGFMISVAAGGWMWNSLPSQLRQSISCGQFR